MTRRSTAAIHPLSLFAIAAPGLEPIVATELTRLGERPRVEDGGVGWDSSDARSLMRANLWLRSASRVLVRVARFRVTEFYDLEKRAKQIDWSRFVAPGQEAEFRVTARKSRLYHSDAIAARLFAAVGSRRSGGRSPKADRRERTAGDQLFVVRVVRDVMEISADSSGDLLHMRGYRLATAKAPLRETIAAALLLASDWRGETPLVDPFCGSGTIPIEGALLARNIAPGLARRFAFMDWPEYDASQWRRLCDDARAVQRPSSVAIHASDRDAGAVESALANAERAGVGGDLRVTRRAVSGVDAPGASGLVCTNPPYGKRVGQHRDVRNLYAQLGNVVRERFTGWELAALVPSAALADQIALPFVELFRTTNGGIPVTAVKAPVA